jgi:prepilin-type N-terminal cleavage/methylation domain-containing protein
MLHGLRAAVSRRKEVGGRTSASDGSDQGFTLVELLVTLTVVPLVVGGISVALLSVFSLQSGVSNRISGSGDQQAIESVFARDVQGAELIETAAAPPGSFACGSSGTQLLGLSWNGGQNLVSYVVVSTGSSYSLMRNACSNGSATPATSTISTHLSFTPASLATSATQVDTCGSVLTSCSFIQQSWTAASGIAGVELNVAEVFTNGKGNYSYTLFASPRAWNVAFNTGTNHPYAPFTLLSQPSSCAGNPVALNIDNNATVTITGSTNGSSGALSVNSPCSGSIDLNTRGVLNASAILTNDPSLNSLTGGYLTPPPESDVGTASDPFAGVLSPPTYPAAADGQCIKSVVSGATTWTCSSGNYSSANLPSFANGVSIVFTGGGVTYFNGGLSLPNNVTVQFDSGSYVFDGATALLTSQNDTITGTNVLFYIPQFVTGTSTTPAVTFDNNTNISLTGSSSYNGIAIWDASSGTINLVNGTALNGTSNTYGGIYMPNGTVETQQVTNLNTTFIIANTASFSQNTTVTITTSS